MAAATTGHMLNTTVVTADGMVMGSPALCWVAKHIGGLVSTRVRDESQLVGAHRVHWKDLHKG